MEDLRAFTKAVPSDLRDLLRKFLISWESNRTYYMFLAKEIIGPYSHEGIKIVHSVDVDAIVRAIENDPDFQDKAREKRYGSIKDISMLSKDQIKALIWKMSEQSEIAFLNSDFEMINPEIEALIS